MAGCEVAFAITLDYVKERKAFGKPIGSFQHSRFLMAELRTKIEISRAFVDRYDRALRGRARATVEEAAMAKWWTTDLPGRGDRRRRPAARRLRVLRRSIRSARRGSTPAITRIYAGTNEIMKELIGRTMGL